MCFTILFYLPVVLFAYIIFLFQNFVNTLFPFCELFY
nr:MAG TPA: hypothetical protein [Caudoviricetes sp.]